MAPKRTSWRPSPRNRAAFVSAAWARVLKARSENSTLRRFKNGLLDVSRKSQEHLHAIKSNSETPLLRLPPEVRNRIWEYTLGGRVLDVVLYHNSVAGREASYYEEKTALSKDSFPEHSHALLQVCRQIYAEAALLPFSTNTFLFAKDETFDWAHHLLSVQRNLIKDVHIVTHRAERMFYWVDSSWRPATLLPGAFPIEVFPKVKNVVVEIRRSHFHDWESGVNLTAKQYRTLVTQNIDKIIQQVHEAKPDVNIVVKHTNLSESVTETGMTDSEDSD